MISQIRKILNRYKKYLQNEEKSPATIEKYVRDVTAFLEWKQENRLSKETVLMYKDDLIAQYAPASVNSMLSSLNNFFRFYDRPELCVKTLKIQRQLFSQKSKELTKDEYKRLLNVAQSLGNQRLYLLMQTICAAGIRVSELKYITIDAIKSEQAVIHCKGKTRIIIIPKQLCKMLRAYTKEHGIKSGSVFQTKNGKPLDRSNIWSDMKKLCETAGVSKDKVFPHNLRHLFARTYYSLQKDIVRLADILGHSSVDTTRIYTAESGDIHRKQIQKLGLLRC